MLKGKPSKYWYVIHEFVLIGGELIGKCVFSAWYPSAFAKEVEGGVPKTDVCRPPKADRPSSEQQSIICVLAFISGWERGMVSVPVFSFSVISLNSKALLVYYREQKNFVSSPPISH